MATRTRRSSDNVFRHVGFGAAEAENLRLRSDLMIELGKMIRSRRLTQAKAAAMLGVSQPRVSDLMRGRIDRFSVDTLVSMLGNAGIGIRLVVTPRSRGASSGSAATRFRGAPHPASTPRARRSVS